VRKLRVPAVALPLDVADATSVAAFVRAVTLSLGPIRDLVNVASYAAPSGGYRAPLAKLDFAELVRAVEVDLVGSLRMIRACAPSMRRAGGGAVVNFGSASADAADPDLLVYMAAKVSLGAYTRAGASARADDPRQLRRAGRNRDDWTRRGMRRRASRWSAPRVRPSRRAGRSRSSSRSRLGRRRVHHRQTLTIDGGMFNP
jgi:NAD(P)-dependent dehydrogenase (short-subunit alcohol dehydrogenase family)